MDAVMLLKKGRSIHAELRGVILEGHFVREQGGYGPVIDVPRELTLPTTARASPE